MQMKVTEIETNELIKMWNFAFNKRKAAEFSRDDVARKMWDDKYAMLDKEIEKRILQITE